MPSETNSNFGTVSGPHWTDAYLIGGGPSLRGFVFERLQGRTVVAVNDAILHLPWAAALFSLDKTWIGNRVREIDAFQGERYLAVAEDFSFTGDHVPCRATYLRRIRSVEGLSENPEAIRMGGGNSGFGALNLAFLKGARRIILLGYDFRQAGTHWHHGYSWSGGDDRSRLYLNWAAQFALTLPQLRRHGVTVWNASPNSAVTAFPTIGLDALPLAVA